MFGSKRQNCQAFNNDLVMVLKEEKFSADNNAFCFAYVEFEVEMSIRDE